MSLQYRHPSLEDAHEIYQLAKSTDQLDRYPEYFYLLWCRDFKGTSLIAKKDHVLAGFIIGYIRPEDPATLLIWQQAMSPKILNRGTGVRMLYYLTKKCVSNGTRFIEATIDPKNQPAERTLLGISKKFNTKIKKR
nr:GNAT family N-acetyltransferase [Halomonas socia]